MICESKALVAVSSSLQLSYKQSNSLYSLWSLSLSTGLTDIQSLAPLPFIISPVRAISIIFFTVFRFPFGLYIPSVHGTLTRDYQITARELEKGFLEVPCDL